MQTYAIIENGSVTNVAIWDGETDWTPDGELIDLSELPQGAGIGWQLIDNEWVAPIIEQLEV